MLAVTIHARMEQHVKSLELVQHTRVIAPLDSLVPTAKHSTPALTIHAQTEVLELHLLMSIILLWNQLPNL